MPLYDYECEKCGRYEVTQRITEPALTKCERCGSKEASAPPDLQRIVQPQGRRLVLPGLLEHEQLQRVVEEKQRRVEAPGPRLSRRATRASASTAS